MTEEIVYEKCPEGCPASQRGISCGGWMAENASYMAPPPCPVCHNAGNVPRQVDA